MEKYSKIGLPALIGALILFVFAVKTFVNIGYGEAGVLFRTFDKGVVTDEPPLPEGLNIVMPWNKVFIYNVKQQEVFESKMQVLSSNGLDISLDISVLYQPKIEELGLLHQTKGSNYLNVVIIPSLRAVARSVIDEQGWCPRYGSTDDFRRKIRLVDGAHHHWQHGDYRAGGSVFFLTRC